MSTQKKQDLRNSLSQAQVSFIWLLRRAQMFATAIWNTCRVDYVAYMERNNVDIYHTEKEHWAMHVIILNGTRYANRVAKSTLNGSVHHRFISQHIEYIQRLHVHVPRHNLRICVKIQACFQRSDLKGSWVLHLPLKFLMTEVAHSHSSLRACKMCQITECKHNMYCDTNASLYNITVCII